MRPAVFLDRDGTLNHCFPTPDGSTTRPPSSLDEMALVHDAADACARLGAAGYLLLLVTNQPDVRRGTQTQERVEALNHHLITELHLDGGAACFHDDRDRCDCRKPKPGLILALADRHGVDIGRSWMVGDRPTDILAGRAAGCDTVLVSADMSTETSAETSTEISTETSIETSIGASTDPRFTEPGPTDDNGPDRGRGRHHRVSSLSAAADLIIASRTHRTTPSKTPPRGADMHRKLSDLTVKIFADGADIPEMMKLAADPLIQGFTTNPTLMRKAGVTSYGAFAREVLDAIPEMPVSFEVLSDDIDRMADEARVIGTWGANVYVKVPITNTQGESTLRIIRDLNAEGVKLNVTAITTVEQALGAARHLTSGTPAIISVFAGRIADTGRDPVPMMTEVSDVLQATPEVELLWASPRELLNVFHAEDSGCHIITVTADLLAKRHLVGKDLDEYSLDTVRMFFNDSSGLDVVLDMAATG